jgi:hypothetical protein
LLKIGFDLPDAVVEDAFKICADESWYASTTSRAATKKAIPEKPVGRWRHRMA